MAISLGSKRFITLYYILDPICSQQRARDHSKLQEILVVKGDLCVCAAEKEYRDICLEQLSIFLILSCQKFNVA